MKPNWFPKTGIRRFPILKDLTVIGRREFCDVKIDHNSLSKRHCVLVKTDGLLVIRDLVTTNGTKVKGQRVRWAALLPEDRITLGALKFRVYLGPDHLPAPSERLTTSRARTSSKATPTRVAKRAIAPPPPSPLTPPSDSPPLPRSACR